MRKLMLLFLILAILLCGCGNHGETPVQTDETTLSDVSTLPTQPAVPWVRQIGTPWDLEGKLLEIPLTIPGASKYTSVGQIDGDLLLYTTDRHLQDNVQMEMCIVDLDTGEIHAEREIDCGDFAAVQVLNNSIFLRSPESGQIQQLDKDLNLINTWQPDAPDSSWYVGMGDQFYRYQWSGELLIQDMNTGSSQPVLPGNPYVTDCILEGEQLCISFIQEDTGDYGRASLDLRTGDLHILDETGEFSNVVRGSDFWLYSTYWDDYKWYLQLDEGETLWLPEATSELRLLEDGRILEITEEGNCLNLYDSRGNALANCRISWNVYEYTVRNVIPNEKLGGYFLVLGGFESDFRLLYWDTSVGTPGENLPWEAVPEASEVQQLLEQKAQILEEKYGVVILVGEQCDTVYDSFTASQANDYELVFRELELIDAVLGRYPEGFFRQIRQGDQHSIRIQLIQDLWADGEGRYGDGYVAFAQDMWDHYLIVVDISASDESAYYHEISHIVDSYLEWDCYNREDALFSEAGWGDLNPAWFDDYTYDYSWEQELLSDGWFIDSYSTISPTEDRARVLEYAMLDYHRELFSEHFGLRQKLEYYSRCIRDAFDTTGWPDVLAWEQHLYG